MDQMNPYKPYAPLQPIIMLEINVNLSYKQFKSPKVVDTLYINICS